jgi:hypothetical protein
MLLKARRTEPSYDPTAAIPLTPVGAGVGDQQTAG